jgi:dipeptidyl aminopeptidase/acylaminoacyl peptidase
MLLRKRFSLRNPFFRNCTTAPLVPFTQLGTIDTARSVRFFYPSAGGDVEAYLSRPRGEGPFPLVVLLHGHSFVGRGAEQLLSTVQAFAAADCFASLAISLPGYGSTKLPPGSVVELTHQVVKDGVCAARQLSWINGHELMLFGVSRGAIVAAAMLNEVEGVRGAVLYSGAYDLGVLYRETRSFWVRKILHSQGAANPKLIKLLGEASKWRVPTLILHGARDKVIPVSQALLLSERLKAAGAPHRTVVYPDHGHFLPRAKIREESLNFLKQTFAAACPAGDSQANSPSASHLPTLSLISTPGTS